MRTTPRVAGFRSESPAGFELECMAGFVGIRILLGLIDEQPDLTLDEVISTMRRHKIPGSRTAVWRFFQRHKITFKKSLARGRAAARGRGARPAALDARTGHV